MELIPYNESNISMDSLKILQKGASIIRETDNEIKYISDNVNELRGKINLLKKERKNAENSLLPIMIDQDIDCLNVNNGSINFIEKIKKNPINKKNLEKLLLKFFSDESNLLQLNNIIGNNNIEQSELRTKFLVEFLINHSDKKKIVILKSNFC